MVKIPNDEVTVDYEMAYKIFYAFFPGLDGYKIEDVEFQGTPVFRVAEYHVQSIPQALEEFEQDFTERTGKDTETVRITYGGVVVRQNRVQILYVILRGEEELLSRRIDTIGVDIWDSHVPMTS